MSTAHQFALYYKDLSTALAAVKADNLLYITDQDLVHRIKHVLRLQEHEELALFDTKSHCVCTIQSSDKKTIVCSVLNKASNNVLLPKITVLLPLLKKEALEEALYSCVELGANTVQLVVTQKVQRHWGGDKEMVRLHNIMVAAAEQSKNFLMPELHAPITLATVLDRLPSSAYKIVSAVQGAPFMTVMQEVQAKNSSDIVLIFGPEGDLTPEEYTALATHAFNACALTPTVLRSQQALVVMLAAVRCVMR